MGDDIGGRVMRLRVSVLNKQVTGFAHGRVRGRTAISPAVAYTGRWWWKKRYEGFAVQVVEWQDFGGPYVDIVSVWRTRGFYTTRDQAEAFARELQRTEADDAA